MPHVGKWRDRADAQQRSSMTQRFATFLARFGYPAE
jgi:hypothetical protein